MVSFPSYVNLPKGRERLIQQFTLYIYVIYICVYTYCVMVYGSLLLIISNQWLLIIIINQTIYSNEQAHVWPYALHSFNEFLHGEGFSESVVIPLPTCRCMTVDLHWTLLLELVCVHACSDFLVRWVHMTILQWMKCGIRLVHNKIDLHSCTVILGSHLYSCFRMITCKYSRAIATVAYL